MITATLIQREPDSDELVVGGVGTPPFWPHDGDVVTRNDISWLRETKGWHAEVVPAEGGAA